MKVKVISRNAEDYTRSRSQDIFKVHRNVNPSVHPFEKAREYTRALNATKLERVFAKPFVGALSGHRDGVYSMAKHSSYMSCILSGSGDGEIRLWNLINQSCVFTIEAHKAFVRGVCFTKGGDSFLSCGDDKAVKLWDLDYLNKNWKDASDNEPSMTYLGKYAFRTVDAHYSRNQFVTASDVVDLWDIERSEPIQKFSWNADVINAARFNRTETSIFAACGSDRNVILYDLRTNKPLSQVVLSMASNSICWNPMEAFNFTVANEDHNLYTFDMRKLDKAIMVHKDHVAAVMDVDYSPTGQEFVSGSYDQSIRIFNFNQGRSKEIYHARRMQRIFCVKYSLDSKFIMSGSDDTNIRLWKANASDKIGPLSTRERNALEYNNSLKDRYKHLPEIRRIAKHRHIPKPIYKATKAKRIMSESIKRREENERRHTEPGTVPYVAEREKAIVSVE